jgi:hypothetical protein
VKQGEFIHIACAVDFQRKEAHLYENGILKCSVKLEDGYHRVEEMVLGQIRIGQSLNFMLDEFILRNRALTASEVFDESRSKTSLRYRLGGSQLLKVKFLQSIRQMIQTGINCMDALNPFYHESFILKAGLPQFNLLLSKKDLKALNKFQYLSLHHGITPEKISTSRQIKVEKDGKLIEVQMELYGEEHHLSPNGKKSFSLEFRGYDEDFAMKKIVFVPPETNGLLRPLFESRLARKYGFIFPKGDVGIVFINGIYQGLYYFEEEGLFDYSGDYNQAWHVDELMKKIPAFKTDLLAIYDDLVKTYLPLLIRDKSSYLGSRELVYRIRADRVRLEQMISERLKENEQNRVKQVEAYLNEKVVLRDNPSQDYIIDPLDLSMKEIDGVRIQWESHQPNMINEQGQVFRPEDQPVQVIVRAHLSFGKATGMKVLKFIVMPRELELSIVKIFTRAKIRAFDWEPCLIQWVEQPGQRYSDPMYGKIKFHGNTALHYPKKSFKLRLPLAKRFMDFSPSREFVFMSSYSDYTLMHNQLAYDLFRSFSKSNHPEYAPKHHLVELFLDHEYLGIYEICENVDAQLLGLSPFKKDQPIHSVLYKAVMRQANFLSINHAFYEQKEPDLKLGEYWRPYDDLIKFLGEASPEIFRRDVEKMIDVENAIDFQILLSITNQMDGPDHNLFIARDNHPADKFFIVPWDYDKSFGGPYDRMRISSLSQRLMKDLPGYIPALQARWNALRESVLSEDSLMKRVDQIEHNTRDAASRNFKLWPIPGGKTHEVAVQEMKDWIKKRLVFLDEYMKNLGTRQ